MRVGVFTVTLFILVCVFGQHNRCKSGYHFWRPYNGTLPRDAFVAGVDANGRKNVVARVVVPDSSNLGTWTLPAQLKEYSDHVHVAWHNPPGKDFLISEYIEVLCSENPENLDWVPVKRYAEEIAEKCCFIQGGKGLNEGHHYNVYVGKGISNGNIYIGRIYREKNWNGLSIMNGSTPGKIDENFQVLTYNCEDDVHIEYYRRRYDRK